MALLGCGFDSRENALIFSLIGTQCSELELGGGVCSDQPASPRRGNLCDVTITGNLTLSIEIKTRPDRTSYI